MCDLCKQLRIVSYEIDASLLDGDIEEFMDLHEESKALDKQRSKSFPEWYRMQELIEPEQHFSSKAIEKSCRTMMNFRIKRAGTDLCPNDYNKQEK